MLEDHFHANGHFDDLNTTQYIPPEKYDQPQSDTLFTTDVQTHLGKVRIHQHKLKHRYLYRTNRAGLHGNGVVPQMCSVAIYDLLNIILDKKIDTNYLPIGFSSVESLETSLANQKTSFSKIKNNKSYNRNKTSTQQLIQTFWATPVKRDDKDTLNRKIAKDRIKAGAITISRAHGNIGQIFYQYYLHNNLIPQPFLGKYIETSYNPNQNWVESLMGLPTGWTHPLFGWNVLPDQTFVDAEPTQDTDTNTDTNTEND